MSQPSQEALEEYDLEEGATVHIDSVYDGLPASEAGLTDGDILVELDGQKPLDEAKVRKILREKSPGDQVKVHWDPSSAFGLDGGQDAHAGEIIDPELGAVPAGTGS